MRNTILLTILFLFEIFNISAKENCLSKNWKFFLGDIPEAKYVDYDDSEWKDISIPHDWAFENGYSANASQKDKGGYLGGGIGWYRKEIYLTEKDLSDDFIFIDFEASYMNNQVWINGNIAGERPYGYIPFSFDIKKYLVEGRNIISLRGKSPQDNVEIYYTTDGRKPDKNCKKYNAPFSLKEAATVKAVIYINGKDEIYMQESFGPNEGLYWGKPGEPACEFNGE